MKENMQLTVGRFVRSKAGRDKHRVFLVIDILDSEYVLLVDGDLRKIESPKKKKIKHLSLLDQQSNDIAKKIEEKTKLNNSMIRREIEKLGVR
jgi:ribosomal protein L14E/L6E/L27E